MALSLFKQTLRVDLKVHARNRRVRDLYRGPRTFLTTETGSMFGDYSIGDLGAIFAMQGFAGLILFSVYVLMALGLAIIFGQMGVINMAHGEFMILGAYVTWMTSNFFQSYLPGLFGGYFFVAMILAFLASGALGTDPASLQAPAGYAAGDLGTEPYPAAGLSFDLRRARSRR